MIKRVLITLKNNMYYSLGIRRSFAKILKRNPAMYFFIVYCLCLLILLVYKYSFSDDESEEGIKVSLEEHNLTIARYFELRKNWNTSNLGSLLFRNVHNSFRPKHKTFVILVWKYWNWLRKRHVYNYGTSGGDEILNGCSVENCVFTGSHQTMNTSDAVVVHMMHGKYPKVKKRNPKQIWIFLNDEAPPNTFSMARGRINVETWANVFNWSMTYRSDADVPVPYGRTVALKKPVTQQLTDEAITDMIPYFEFKRTDVLVAVLMSNCNVKYRNHFLTALQKYINVDVYGQCGVDEKKEQCRGHFKTDCPVLDEYYFYLVMENRMCNQYITEKSFYNGYAKGAIPILVGTFLTDIKTLLPPNSYIHSGDYNSLKELAAKINGVIQNITEYVSYHQWRNHFQVKNEHGYFGTKSRHLCRICEALNYNEEREKVYNFEDLRSFLDSSMLCQDVKVPA